MSKFFSVATGGFYVSELRADYDGAGTWPADAVEVDAATETELRTAICRGDTILYSNDKFIFSPAPLPPFAPIAAAYLDIIRAIREKILNRLAGIGFSALMSGDTELAQAVAAARQAMLDITTGGAVLAATDIGALKVAVRDSYCAAVASAPAELIKAFDAGDL